MTEVKTEEIKSKVMKFAEPDDRKAWISLGYSLCIELVAILLIRTNLLIMGWGLHTLNEIRLFVQFHDMAHLSFFNSMTLNKVLGNVLGIYNHFPFAAWRDGHNHHHKHFGNLDRLDLSQTILFTKSQYNQMSPLKRFAIRLFRQPIVFFLVTAPLVWFVGLFISIGKRYGFVSIEFFQKILSVVIYTWVCPLIGISALYMWITVYFTNVFGTMLFHIQHSVNIPYRQRKEQWNFSTAALQGSTFFMVPWYLKIFTLGIEYHHIHHLNTKVPGYQIQNCHETIEQESCGANGWEKYNINQVDLSLAFKSLFNVMLDEENHVLTPFSYNLTNSS